MKRIITDPNGQLDNAKIFWLVFWLIMLVININVVQELSSIASSLRIMSQVTPSSQTIVVPSTVTPTR